MIADSLLALIGRFDATFATASGCRSLRATLHWRCWKPKPAPDLLKLHRFMRSEAVSAAAGRRRRARCAGARVLAATIFPNAARRSARSVDALVRRLGMFLMQPVIRNIVCRPRTTLDFRAAMDQGQIVLASLPVEVIGNRSAALPRLMLQELLNTAAFSRSADHVPVEKRALLS